MKSLKWLVMAVALVAGAGSAGAVELARLTVNDVGTTLDMPEILNPWQVAVSPDGQWIAYTENKRKAIFLKPMNGGPERLLYYYDQFAEQFKNDPIYNGINNQSPYSMGSTIHSLTFTPDSKEVTFQIDIYDSTLGSTWQFRYDKNGNYDGESLQNQVPYIKSINIYTGELRDLTTGSYMNWDPKGRFLWISYNFDPRTFLDPLQAENHFLPVVYDTITDEKWAIDKDIQPFATFTQDGNFVLGSKPVSQKLTRPDGTTASTYQVFKSSVFGGYPVQVTSMIDDTYTRADYFVLSPDQKWLFFTKSTNVATSVKAGIGSYSGIASTLSVLNMETGKFYDLLPLTDNLWINPISISADGNILYVHVSDSYIRLFKDVNGNQNRGNWVVAYHFDPANIGKPFNFTNVVTPPVVISEGWGNKIDVQNPDTNPLAAWSATFKLSTKMFSTPVWSPDGNTVSFIPSLTWGVWTVPAAGGKGTLVYYKDSGENKISGYYHPVYTPDGKEITCVLKGGTFTSGSTKITSTDRIVSIGIATGEAQEIVKATNSDQQLQYPIWSSSGRYLSYFLINSTKTDSLMILDTITNETRLLAESNNFTSRQSFFPDGSAVVYSDTGNLFRVPITSGTPEPIVVQDRHGISYDCRFPSVHPDGKHIIFQDMGALNLKMVNILTGAVTTISPTTGGAAYNPSLSFDGTKICYEYRTPNELHIIELDSSLFNDDSSVTVVENKTPKVYSTLVNYPNPFNPATTLSFTLPESGYTELSIYNLAGQKIRTLVASELAAGAHSVVWDGRDGNGNPVSSGLFVSRLHSGDTVVTNRMTLVK